MLLLSALSDSNSAKLAIRNVFIRSSFQLPSSGGHHLFIANHRFLDPSVVGLLLRGPLSAGSAGEAAGWSSELPPAHGSATPASLGCFLLPSSVSPLFTAKANPLVSTSATIAAASSSTPVSHPRLPFPTLSPSLSLRPRQPT